MAEEKAGCKDGRLFHAWYNRIIYAMACADLSGHNVTLRWNTHESIARRLAEGRKLEWFQEEWEHYRREIEAS